MSPAAKTTRGPVMEEGPFKPEIRDEAAAMFLRGVERIAEAEKQLLDTAAQQNKEMMDVVKKAAANIPGMPRLPLLDLVYGAMNRYVDVQKSVVDLMVEQNRIWTDAFTDRTGAVRKSGESATHAMKQAMESSFAVQKKALEHTAAHTKAVMDAARNQFGVSGTQADVMTDTFRRGVDTIVEAQKELLNMVVH